MIDLPDLMIEAPDATWMHSQMSCALFVCLEEFSLRRNSLHPGV
jgi:hypothetical protein